MFRRSRPPDRAVNQPIMLLRLRVVSTLNTGAAQRITMAGERLQHLRATSYHSAHQDRYTGHSGLM
jgi:hypothetical protein